IGAPSTTCCRGEYRRDPMATSPDHLLGQPSTVGRRTTMAATATTMMASPTRCEYARRRPSGNASPRMISPTPTYQAASSPAIVSAPEKAIRQYRRDPALAFADTRKASRSAPMGPGLTKDEQEWAVRRLRHYFEQERGEELNELGAALLLDFL